MEQISQAYEQLIEKVVEWARTQSDIRAAVVVGSRARVQDHPADKWADLDLILVATHPDRYLSRTDWLDNIGKPWVSYIEDTSTGGEKELRVLFEGGLDVDFAIIPYRIAQALVFVVRIQKRFPFFLRIHSVERLLQRVAGFYDMVNRGIRVLVDKDRMIAHLALVTVEPPHRPSEANFSRVVNNFWYQAVWTAKHLRRGELWRAKSCCDVLMKWLLFKVIEWHAQSSKNKDTWHRGHFLEEWADSRVLKELRDVYAHYDENDLRRALIATMNLFRWLAIETAEGLKYPYPAFGDERATELVKVVLAENS